MADNLFSDLSRMIEQVGKDKGIDKELVIDAVVQGMLVAARKKYGSYRDIEAMFNEDIGEVELVEFKEVVSKEDFIDELVEIILEEALELDPEAQIGDSIGIPLDGKDLGRIAVQTARQIIIQKVRDAEREVIHAEFSQREGEIASGIARRVERGSIVVDLGRTEAHMPYREQIPGEQYKSGDRIQGFISEVRQTPRGPQIIMSRADERYLMKLFEIEVPEIDDGTIEIMAAAREPGQRAKIAVRTSDPTVDPVGACVRMKGSRVQNIVQELKGEKIDIITWDEDITRFACNALAPAEISKVFVDEGNNEMEVVVPDNQLSLAIGKKGQNVRLAAKLTKWKLDIASESQAASKAADAVFNLMLIPGITDTMATALFQYGYGNFYAVAEAPVEEFVGIPGFDAESAEKLVADANVLAEKYKDGEANIPTREITPEEVEEQQAASTGGSAKEIAEQRLKEGLAELAGNKDADPKQEEAND
ncbi:MAG: transcription termination factor NusA [Bdellovibrionales bacterium]